MPKVEKLCPRNALILESKANSRLCSRQRMGPTATARSAAEFLRLPGLQAPACDAFADPLLMAVPGTVSPEGIPVQK